MKLVRALTLLTVGVVGLIIVYSMRPPSGLLDAVGMYAQGKSHFLKAPVYHTLLSVFTIISLVGAISTARQLAERERAQG